MSGLPGIKAMGADEPVPPINNNKEWLIDGSSYFAEIKISNVGKVIELSNGFKWIVDYPGKIENIVKKFT